MENEALVNKLSDATRVQLERDVIEQLRVDGGYTRLAARARAKRRTLLAAGSDHQGDENAIEELRALAWYFEQRPGARLPDEPDTYAACLGFASAAAFRRAVVREYRYELVVDEACNQ